MKPSQRYRAYLRSPMWRRKRDEYWRARGKHCQVCGSRDRLEVDHLDYARLGRELLTDLLGLCHDHHVMVTIAREEAGVRSGEGYRRVTEKLFDIRLPRPADHVSVQPSEPYRGRGHVEIPPHRRTVLPPAKRAAKSSGPKPPPARTKGWVRDADLPVRGIGRGKQRAAKAARARRLNGG